MRHYARIARALPLALFALLLFAGCGSQEYTVVGTARAAGAEGTIQVEEIEEGNSLVTIEMAHLPPPDRLAKEHKVYVVWFQEPNGQPQKAGRLSYDPDSREGSMMATSPLNQFTVKISAEKNANVPAPSDIIVAQRKIGQ